MKRCCAYYCHQIITFVTAEQGIPEEELFVSQDIYAQKARMRATYLMRRMTKAPLTMISEVLGYDSPKEVLCAIRLQEAHMKQNPAMRQQIELACNTIADEICDLM